MKTTTPAVKMKENENDGNRVQVAVSRIRLLLPLSEYRGTSGSPVILRLDITTLIHILYATCVYETNKSLEQYL
jgi:hypothetical protein